MHSRAVNVDSCMVNQKSEPPKKRVQFENSTRLKPHQSTTTDGRTDDGRIVSLTRGYTDTAAKK
jgi:hypothetical protein